MNLQKQLKGLKPFLDMCKTYTLDTVLSISEIHDLVAANLGTYLDQERVIGTGPNGIQLRFDVNNTWVTFTLEDDDVVIDSYEVEIELEAGAPA